MFLQFSLLLVAAIYYLYSRMFLQFISLLIFCESVFRFNLLAFCLFLALI